MDHTDLEGIFNAILLALQNGKNNPSCLVPVFSIEHVPSIPGRLGAPTLHSASFIHLGHQPIHAIQTFLLRALFFPKFDISIRP